MIIEAVTEQDAEALLSIYSPYVQNTAVSFEYEVPTVQDFQNRINSITQKLPYLKAVDGGNIIGYAYASPFHTRKAYEWSVELSIYIACNNRHLGCGKALYSKLEDILKDMGILTMYALISLPHGMDSHLTTDSFLFHQKMNFKPVGTFYNSGYKFETWYDTVYMERQIGEHTIPQPPVHFGCWRDFFDIK